MTAISITRFGGMIPRAGDQVIPEGMASFAENALLLSGELRGIRGKAVKADLQGTGHTIRRLYRTRSESGDDWITFDDPTVDMVKAPLVNDLHERYYWTSENGAPRVASLTDMLGGGTGFPLGVPAPTAAPTVSVVGGTVNDVSRAYVYTYVTNFGEESAPSPATLGSGYSDATWTIGNLVDPPAGRNIIYKRVYRTVTTTSGRVEYHEVWTTAVANQDYVDDQDTNTVAKNNTLESEFFSEPPENLIGLVAHPNGFLVGFDGRDLYFSEPYRPHAWPQEYILSAEDIIQGLGVYSTSVAVGTRGHPYVVTGIHPSAMTFTKAQTPSPCVSDRRGIVPMPFGVYYPSDAGLMLVSSAGFQNATKNLLTKTEWQRHYTPSNLNAVRWQSQYVAFHSATKGFMFAPDEPQSAFVELDSVWTHTVLQSDTGSGEVFMVDANIVYEWNPAYGIPQTYKWRSKEYVTPNPVNFGALAVEFGAPREISDEVVEEADKYNAIRAEYPLNPLNWHVLNGVRRLVEKISVDDWIADKDPSRPPDGIVVSGYDGTPITHVDNKQPFHASPLIATGRFGSSPNASGSSISVYSQFAGDTVLNSNTYVGELSVSIYADGVMIWRSNIHDEEQYKLPSGYKSRRWVFELEGTIDVQAFKIAETGKELSRV